MDLDQLASLDSSGSTVFSKRMNPDSAGRGIIKKDVIFRRVESSH